MAFPVCGDLIATDFQIELENVLVIVLKKIFWYVFDVVNCVVQVSFSVLDFQIPLEADGLYPGLPDGFEFPFQFINQRLELAGGGVERKQVISVFYYGVNDLQTEGVDVFFPERQRQAELTVQFFNNCLVFPVDDLVVQFFQKVGKECPKAGVVVSEQQVLGNSALKKHRPKAKLIILRTVDDLDSEQGQTTFGGGVQRINAFIWQSNEPDNVHLACSFTGVYLSPPFGKTDEGVQFVFVAWPCETVSVIGSKQAFLDRSDLLWRKIHFPERGINLCLEGIRVHVSAKTLWLPVSKLF